MTLTRRNLAGLAVLAATAATAASSLSAQAQTSGRRAETEALRVRAETIHPRGREAAANPDWRARWDNLAASADQLSDGAYFIRTRQALGWFKDGHTTLKPVEAGASVPAQLARGPFGLALPIGVRVFHDGVYVTSAKQEGAALLGAKLTRVGALDVEALIRAFAVNWPGSEAGAHRWAHTLFSPALLQGLGAITDPAAPISIDALLGQRAVTARLRPRADGGADRQPMKRPSRPRQKTRAMLRTAILLSARRLRSMSAATTLASRRDPLASSPAPTLRPWRRARRNVSSSISAAMAAAITFSSRRYASTLSGRGLIGQGGFMC